VLAGILEGKTAATIAAERGAALQTVTNKTCSIYDVLQVRSRAETLVVCAELGVMPRTLEEN
jgi:DNA-binding NarL/FixJ family response regulator